MADRYVYFCASDLRFWLSTEATAIEGRCAIADQIQQEDEDRTRIYRRLTPERWSYLRATRHPDQLLSLRDALVQLYGPSVLLRLAA
jgi:hypothetical protein